MSRLLCQNVVSSFADWMLERLYANEHKPGWRSRDLGDLLGRLSAAVAELRSEVLRAAIIEMPDPRGGGTRLVNGPRFAARLGRTKSIPPAKLDAIRREAADVAHLAMMIVDRCAVLAGRPGDDA